MKMEKQHVATCECTANQVSSWVKLWKAVVEIELLMRWC